MKVAEYLKEGLKNFSEEAPQDYQLLGKAKEGCHRVEFFAKVKDGIVKEAVFNSSKRCKKLLALADVVAEMLKGQKVKNLKINEEKLLETFKDEKDKKKIKERIELIKTALAR